jgi:quercetin dioxygenase-like cupin family protein
MPHFFAKGGSMKALSKLVVLFLLSGVLGGELFGESMVGTLQLKKIKRSVPYVNKKHVRVWNAKLTEHIRINVIEFSGDLPRHMHPDAAHNMFVVEGSVTAIIGAKSYKAKKGSFIFIPKGVAHQYKTKSKLATLIAMDAPYYDRNKTVYFK